MDEQTTETTTNDVPPIKFILMELTEHGPGNRLPEVYDTREEAKKALDALDEPDNYIVAETR